MPQTSSKSAAPSSHFRQIVDHLRSEIVEGGMPEHAALPAERVVAERHGVSRMTARRALEAVEAEGLAYSEGRKGRFVSPRRLKYDIGNKVSFAADAQAAGMDLEILVVEKKSTRADAQLATALSVPVGELLHTYTRLFQIHGHPTFIETEFVIAKRCPDLLTYDLRQSTTKLMERHCGALAHTGDIVMRMRALQTDEAALLGLAAYTAAIELEQVIRDASGEAFCFGRQLWRGELAEFSAQAIVSR